MKMIGWQIAGLGPDGRGSDDNRNVIEFWLNNNPSRYVPHNITNFLFMLYFIYEILQ